MRLSSWFCATMVAVWIAAGIPVFCQVAPSATEGSIPLVVGAGFSNYNIDWCCDRREDGGTLWIGWTIRQMPRILQGVGIEVEARDLSLDPPPVVSFFRYDTAGGGVIYHFLRPRNIHPYAKALEEFGSIDFNRPPAYSHDTRNFPAIGGGADFHAWGPIWVRADYEYQMWFHLFGAPHPLTPNGVTIGPEFDFGSRSSR